jgi:hypothetical protein
MLGWIIGIVLVGLAAFLIGRSVYRTVKGKSGCPGCGNPDCPHNKARAAGR